MKFAVLSFALLSSVNAIAASPKPDPKFDPPAKPGQCYADVFSKQYLDHLSTDSEQFFVCNYNCFDTDGKKHIVKAIGSGNKQRAVRDGSVMVCDGARVVQKTVNGNQIWDFAGVDPFWAAMSSLPEIRDWTREKKVRIAPDDFRALEKQFYENVTAVGVAYYRAGADADPLRIGAMDLLEIGAQTEKGKKLLRSALLQLAHSEGRIQTNDAAHALVLGTILVHGRFMIP